MKRTWISGVALGATLALMSPAAAQVGGGSGAPGGAEGVGSQGGVPSGGGGAGSGAPGNAAGPSAQVGSSGPGGSTGGGDFGGSGGGGLDGGGDAGTTGFSGMMGGGGGDGDVNAVINPGPPGSLEEALERALKDNAEIAVARANRQQAEAAERLAISKVSQKVVEAYQQWQFDREALARATTSHQSAAISDSEFATAKRAESASETALQFLYGGPMIRFTEPKAGGTGSVGKPGGRAPSGDPFGNAGGPMGRGGAAPSGPRNISGVSGAMERGSGGMGGAAGAGDAAPKSKVEENLAKKSDGVDFQEMPLNDIAQFLTETIGSPVIVDKSALLGSLPEGFSVTVELHNDDLTWQNVLTAISDTHDIGFLVRDYGILITTPQKAGIATAGGLGGGGGFGGGGF
jgi:hypothetical protein